VINVENLGLRPIVTEEEHERENEREGEVGGSDLDEDAQGVPRSLPDYLERLEREAIAKALQKTNHNRTAAARLLGITFRALRHRMQRLEID
jgi:DNA-binding NtrC family response regulator